MKFLKENSVNIVLSVLTLLASGLFFYFGQERVSLCYKINSIPIISMNKAQAFNKLMISYSGNKVNNLTISEIVLSNRGNKGMK
jgi:hypothetical protein